VWFSLAQRLRRAVPRKYQDKWLPGKFRPELKINFSLWQGAESPISRGGVVTWIVHMELRVTGTHQPNSDSIQYLTKRDLKTVRERKALISDRFLAAVFEEILAAILDTQLKSRDARTGRKAAEKFDVQDARYSLDTFHIASV
jgi:hypothetical protein